MKQTIYIYTHNIYPKKRFSMFNKFSTQICGTVLNLHMNCQIGPRKVEIRHTFPDCHKGMKHPVGSQFIQYAGKMVLTHTNKQMCVHTHTNTY
jgi:hypothetical protein